MPSYYMEQSNFVHAFYYWCYWNQLSHKSWFTVSKHSAYTSRSEAFSYVALYLFYIWWIYIYIFLHQSIMSYFRVHACSYMLYWINYHNNLVYVPCLSNYDELRPRPFHVYAQDRVLKEPSLFVIWPLYKSKSKCSQHPLRKKANMCPFGTRMMNAYCSKHSVVDSQLVITWDTQFEYITENVKWIGYCRLISPLL